MQDHTQRLSEFVTDTTFEELPVDVVQMAKRCILDFLGCALHGSRTLPGKILFRCVQQFGGRKEATVIGNKYKTNCINAALINGTSSHAFELDDVYRFGLLHPGVGVVPAPLALAERERLSGKDLILAVALGYEVACRVSASVGPTNHYTLGWHPIGTCDPLGAAAGAGKILGLNSEKMANAFGLAGTQSSGLLEASAPYLAKHFLAGKAAQQGIVAALLAREGLTAGNTVLEGKRGFCRAFTNEPHLEKLTERLGESYEFLKTYHKLYPCAGDMFPTIDATLALTQKHDLQPENIRKITVRSFGLILSHFDNYDPKTILASQFSCQYCVAVAIVDKKVSVQQFTEDKLTDPAIRKLMKRIVLESDPEFTKAFPVHYASTVTIEENNGETYTESVSPPQNPRGFPPENPLTNADLQDKFRNITKGILAESRADKVIKVVSELEKTDDITQLMNLV